MIGFFIFTVPFVIPVSWQLSSGLVHYEGGANCFLSNGLIHPVVNTNMLCYGKTQNRCLILKVPENRTLTLNTLKYMNIAFLRRLKK